MASTSSCKFGIALIQLNQTKIKSENLANADKLIREGVAKYNPKIVALPEYFNSPYGSKYFDENAEYIPNGQTSLALSNLARELNIYIVGGSYPEIDENNTKTLYNTIAVFSNTGELVAKHRKVHLADCNLGLDFELRESEKISPGNSLNTFEVDGYKFGLGICYDSFFSEFSVVYQALGCHMIFFPSAFTQEAGHFWDLKMRSRASDNQLFVAGISTSRNINADYVCHGYSCFVNPEGKILKQAGLEEEIVFFEIDFNDVQKYRDEIPMIKHRRFDIYETVLQNDHLNTGN